jgi:hypothetical protein
MEDGLRVCVGVDEPMGAVITSGCESSASERVLPPSSCVYPPSRELCVFSLLRLALALFLPQSCAWVMPFIGSGRHRMDGDEH